MHTYARIDNGRVVEIIEPMTYDVDSPEGSEYQFKAGDEIPIERRFMPAFAAALVDISAVTPQPGYGWTAVDGASGWTFEEPVSA
jgi:hypothetical protein